MNREIMSIGKERKVRFGNTGNQPILPVSVHPTIMGLLHSIVLKKVLC